MGNNHHDLARQIREMFPLAYKVTFIVTANDHFIKMEYRDHKVTGESVKQLDHHCLGEAGYATT